MLKFAHERCGSGKHSPTRISSFPFCEDFNFSVHSPLYPVNRQKLQRRYSARDMPRRNNAATVISRTGCFGRPIRRNRQAGGRGGLSRTGRARSSPDGSALLERNGFPVVRPSAGAAPARQASDDAHGLDTGYLRRRVSQKTFPVLFQEAEKGRNSRRGFSVRTPGKIGGLQRVRTGNGQARNARGRMIRQIPLSATGRLCPGHNSLGRAICRRIGRERSAGSRGAPTAGAGIGICVGARHMGAWGRGRPKRRWRRPEAALAPAGEPPRNDTISPLCPLVHHCRTILRTVRAKGKGA